jgi:signal transduction histidine kinase
LKAIGNFARSSSFQVGVFFTVLLTAGVLFVAYFLYLATEQVFVKESQVALQAELQGLTDVYELGGTAALKNIITERSLELDRPFYYAHVTEGEATDYSDFRYWRDAMKHGKSVSEALPITNTKLMWQQTNLPDGTMLLVARDVNKLEKAQWVARTFGSLTIVTMLLISGLSLWVGYYVVQTINRIADTANNIIQEGKFDERIPIDSSWDDLSKLSVALNSALDELAQKVEGIRTVSDNIAHDLRTPLTRLRASIEGLDNAEQRQPLLLEVDNIMGMFRGLLRIADVESSQRMNAFAHHDLRTIVDDVIELYQPLAEDKHQHIHCQLGKVSVFSDKDLLFQAVANLLDNAIKFTPEHGSITITLREVMRSAILRICDSGPGVDEQTADKMTQRFFRADSSRNKAGNGLGLAMVDAVIKRHKGTIKFSVNPHNDKARGLCCTVELPV